MENAEISETNDQHDARIARQLAALAEFAAKEAAKPQQLESEAKYVSEAVAAAERALGNEQAQLANVMAIADGVGAEVSAALEAVDGAKLDEARATRAYETGEPYSGVTDARVRVEHLELDHRLALSRKARADEVVSEAAARVRAAQWAVEGAKTDAARVAVKRLTARNVELAIALAENIDALAAQVDPAGGDWAGATYNSIEGVTRALRERGIVASKLMRKWVTGE